MQINKIQSSKNPQPSFGKFIVYEGAEQSLKKVLKANEWKEFQKLIKIQKENKLVNIELYGNGSRRIIADVLTKNYLNWMNVPFKKSALQVKNRDKKHYKQHFWQSMISFLRKVSDKADKMEKKYESYENIDIKSILTDVRAPMRPKK